MTNNSPHASRKLPEESYGEVSAEELASLQWHAAAEFREKIKGFLRLIFDTSGLIAKIDARIIRNKN